MSTESDRRVRIGILVYGSQDGYEHIRKVLTRNYVFSESDQVVNFDDVVDFEELNLSFGEAETWVNSPFLIGPDQDCFKIKIVIAPLHELSSLEAS